MYISPHLLVGKWNIRKKLLKEYSFLIVIVLYIIWIHNNTITISLNKGFFVNIS